MFRLSFALLISVAAMLLITPQSASGAAPAQVRANHLSPGAGKPSGEAGYAHHGRPRVCGGHRRAALLLHGAWFGVNDFGLALIVFSLLNMGIGFVDDYIKVVKKRSLGLIWWQKVIGQVLFGCLFAWFCYQSPQIGSRIIIPFTEPNMGLGRVVCSADDIDEHVHGQTAPTYRTGWTVCCPVLPQPEAQLGRASLAAGGAGGRHAVCGGPAGQPMPMLRCSGWCSRGLASASCVFNAYPAKVFMRRYGQHVHRRRDGRHGYGATAADIHVADRVHDGQQAPLRLSSSASTTN